MRLSVTDLDQYLTWLNPPDFMEEQCADPQWLIDRLTLFEPSPAMQAGSAFHKLLETSTISAIGSESVDGYNFKFQCDAEITLPVLRELKIEREILPGIALVGKIDGMDGNRIIDYKLTERLDAERYVDSMQWRAYLTLFGTSEFEYSIFEGSPDRGKEMDYTIYAHRRLTFYAYPEMRSDVLKCVEGLAEFVRMYNVQSKLKGTGHESMAE